MKFSIANGEVEQNMSRIHGTRDYFYPEARAGGFTRIDGTVAFYSRVNALLRKEMHVLDFGAGRGRVLDEEPSYRRDLQIIRGKVSSVVGVDVDAAVAENKVVDVRHVIKEGAGLPLDDESVDLVVSDFTFEHVDEPVLVASELTRVLRPGGWICARTPNRFGIIAIGARMIPNSLHVNVLKYLQPAKLSADTFPTRYKMNSLRTLETLFPAPAFRHCSYSHDSQPAYGGSSILAWRFFRLVAACSPPPFRSMLHVFIQKTDVSPAGEINAR